MAGIGRWIGDTISSLVAGTVQLSLVIVNGSINNLSDKINIGGIANQRNEVKDGQESSSLQTSRPEDLDTFDCTELKTYYSTTLCKASPLPWYPKQTRYIDEVYTELALQDSPTSKFGVEGLFEQWVKHNPKGGSYRILIEGDAGYGKSTLMLKMASDWSESDSKDYISSFSLLFVVKLGHVGEDGNLLSYMEKIYTKKIKKMSKSLEDVLESEGAKKVLVLLDGYDEANPNTKKEVVRIMTKETMSICHVVLTSRCGHVPDDVERIALPVRVTGFGEKQVSEAVGKFFNKTDKPLSLEQFMEKLQAKSPYKELAQCPLLCVMLCCLVSDCPNGKLPSTVSGLYFAMIDRNIYREQRKKEPDHYLELNILQNQIAAGHEGYLQDFGRLCINRLLKNQSMSFSFSDITGNEAGKTPDAKVTQLMAAGVLVQDTNEIKHLYQVPHRTTAEFLAAYCLSRETDQNLCQQNLLDLYRLKASFNEVAASLIEMGKMRCLADAFCDIKFPFNCLIQMPFMKSYFFEHGAGGTWKEFKGALPNKLKIMLKNRSELLDKLWPHELTELTVSSTEPTQNLLHLCQVLGKGNTRETNARPSDCLVSVKVKLSFPEYHSNPELLQMCSKSGVRLDRLDIQSPILIIRGIDFHGEDAEKKKKKKKKRHAISEVVRILQELLKSQSCPVQLSFGNIPYDLFPALIEAMQEVPEGCRLKSFDFSYRTSCFLLRVLAEKWLSHLQHLSLGECETEPILKRLREPGCSLTSLHLSKCNIDIEDLMMLASKLEKLYLGGVKLDFDVTEISKYAVKERCSLKSLRLVYVKLSLKGSLPSVDENQELLRGWRNVDLPLEELTIDNCKFPIELFSWLNLSLPNLRSVTIGEIYWKTPNGDRQFYANQVLLALTRSSGDSIEELSLLQGFWGNQDELMLHPIREALQRCPRMKSVNLRYYHYDYKSAASIGPGPSTPLSPSDEEALKSDNIHNALLKIVLSVPKLQTLTSWFFFYNWEAIGTFHAIADKAEKWPAETNDTGCKTSLTLRRLSKENAFNAMDVFREKGLEYRLRYVTEKKYECWFPPRVVTQFQSV